MAIRGLLVLLVLATGLVPFFREDIPQPNRLRLGTTSFPWGIEMSVPSGWLPHKLPSSPRVSNFVVSAEATNTPQLLVTFGDEPSLESEHLCGLFGMCDERQLQRDKVSGLFWDHCEANGTHTIHVYPDEFPGMLLTFTTRAFNDRDTNATIEQIVRSVERIPMDLETAKQMPQVASSALSLTGSLSEPRFLFPEASDWTKLCRALAMAGGLMALFLLEAFVVGRSHRTQIEQAEEEQFARQSNGEIDVVKPRPRRQRRRRSSQVS